MAAAVPSTATTAEALKKGTRVLAVYGSESGSTKRLLTKTIKDWDAAGATFEVEVLSGNEAIAKYAHLEVIAKTFDAMLVAHELFELQLLFRKLHAVVALVLLKQRDAVNVAVKTATARNKALRSVPTLFDEKKEADAAAQQVHGGRGARE